MNDRSKLKICQYGAECYRKNPIHFGEYAHPHLDGIYDAGKRNGSYNIPDEYAMSKDVIEIQLKLLEKLFPSADIKKQQQQVENATAATVDGGYRLGGTEQADGTAASKSSVDHSHSEKRSKSPLPSTSSAASKAADNSNLAKKQKLVPNIKDYIPVLMEKGKMAEKLAKAAPYNMFLTAITDCKQTHTEALTVTLQEILDKSLGEIESSLQINFMVDIGWLLGHYYFANILSQPLLVLYGDETPELLSISKFKPQVTALKVAMPSPFATSHAKVMVFAYTDGSMRIVISTANLYEDDWHNRTQGIWISPRLPALPEEADTAAGESETGFRQDFMLYLVEYKQPKLQSWLARIRKTDFSSINVFFIGSVPGGFREGVRGHPWGHARVSSLLQKHCSIGIDDKIPIICQSSSIGSLGPNLQAWVQHDFLNSLRKDGKPLGIRQFPSFKMIYPSFENVSNSHDGMLGGGCLPYGKATNDKQPWLKDYLHHWSAKMRHRSKAMPHIKCYTRVNLEQQCVYWFILTSANLSKAAWGSYNKNVNIQQCLRIANYEAGVLFLPKFVTGEDTFPLCHSRGDVPAFPLPYDVPLTAYSPDDFPFLMDYLRS